MIDVKINDNIISFIKNHAKLSENEVYGWLIGYHDAYNIPNIVTVFDCQKYIEQSYINAIPDPIEIQKISDSMPYGIGIIGIYHSHPGNSELFHSQIDNDTLLRLSRQIPNCVSIVTNGIDTNFYKIDHGNKLRKLVVEIGNPKIPKLIPVSFANRFIINIDRELLNDENLNIKISNKFKDYLEQNWKFIKIIKGKKEIALKKKIYQYLKSKLDSSDIELKFVNEKNEEKLSYINIFDVSKFNNSDIQDSNKIISLNLNLRTIDLFYITDDKNSFDELKNSIKLEIINNSLIPKIFHCIVDLGNNELLIPDSYYINFFGYYLKILSYNPDLIEIIDTTLKINKNFKMIFMESEKFVKRISKMLNLYSDLEIKRNFKEQLKDLLYYINEFSDLYALSEELKKELYYIEKNL